MIRGLLGSTACLVLGGCSLILDFSDGAIPVDATADTPFSQAECDYKEPNDSIAIAAVFDPAEVGPAAICSTTEGVDDHDFYRFTVPAGITTVRIRITFQTSPTGDLDLRLYDKTGATVLSSSVGFMDVEEITCPGQSPLCNQNMMLAPDDYIFEVYSGVAGGANRYDISLSLL